MTTQPCSTGICLLLRPLNLLRRFSKAGYTLSFFDLPRFMLCFEPIELSSNPWSREGFNLMAQGRIAHEAPERARQLQAQAAGTPHRRSRTAEGDRSALGINSNLGCLQLLARFLSPALHQKLIDDGRCRVFEMLRQCLPVLVQLRFIEHPFGDDLVSNRVDEREKVRATVIAKGWCLDRHSCVNILDARGV